MRIDRQDLQKDSARRCYWSYGRAWLRRDDWHRKRLGSLCVEWTVPCSSCGWSVRFGGGDSGTDLGFQFAIPLVLTLFLTINNVWKSSLFSYDFDRGSDRKIGVSFHDGSIWYSIWVGGMASWSRRYPWCRWYRQGNVNFLNLILGRAKCSTEILREGIQVQIPMPEGVYMGLVKVERRTWKRPRWFNKVRVSTWLDIPKGIPHAGKGENSWDCGDDGLFGIGAEGTEISDVIGRAVSSVLRDRQRYGHASDQAVARALQT